MQAESMLRAHLKKHGDDFPYMQAPIPLHATYALSLILHRFHTAPFYLP